MLHRTKLTLLVLQIFSMDIMRHKDAVDEIVKTGKAIMSSKNPEEKEMLKVRKYISDLKHFFIEKMRRS